MRKNAVRGTSIVWRKAIKLKDCGCSKNININSQNNEYKHFRAILTTTENLIDLGRELWDGGTCDKVEIYCMYVKYCVHGGERLQLFCLFILKTEETFLLHSFKFVPKKKKKATSKALNQWLVNLFWCSSMVLIPFYIWKIQTQPQQFILDHIVLLNCKLSQRISKLLLLKCL